MTVVEKLKRLSDAQAKGRISQAEFDRKRAVLLDEVEVAQTVTAPAESDPVEARFDPGTTLVLVILLSILPGLLAMLVLGLPFWTGAVIFVTCLGALTWLWARSLPAEEETGAYPKIDLDKVDEITV